MPSYRNQSIDLLCKSIDWFLCECLMFNDLKLKMTEIVFSGNAKEILALLKPPAHNSFDSRFLLYYTLFYKQHFYKQRQGEIGKKSSKF